MDLYNKNKPGLMIIEALFTAIALSLLVYGGMLLLAAIIGIAIVLTISIQTKN